MPDRTRWPHWRTSRGALGSGGFDGDGHVASSGFDHRLNGMGNRMRHRVPVASGPGKPFETRGLPTRPDATTRRQYGHPAAARRPMPDARLDSAAVPRVLVVDDEEDILLSYRRILQPPDHPVETNPGASEQQRPRSTGADVPIQRFAVTTCTQGAKRSTPVERP